MAGKLDAGEIIDVVVPLARLVAELLKRSAQAGALSDKQRQELGDAAEELFAAASEAPAPPPEHPTTKEV